jgi:CRP-like cAMP-binding protein
VRHPAGEELIAEGQTTRRARFIVSGWANSQRVLADGRRQTFSFILPGDGLGMCPHRPPPALCSVVAATSLETVDAEPVMEVIHRGQSPGLSNAIAAAARLDDILALDHMTRLGSQTAYERLAHFLLELQHRLELAGLGDSHRFPMPLTQEMLADALGLSIVHINRTLQQLRRDRLIELRSGVAVLLDREAMVSLADFRWPKATPAIANLG